MQNHDLLEGLKRDLDVQIKFPKWHPGILYQPLLSIKILKFIITNQ